MSKIIDYYNSVGTDHAGRYYEVLDTMVNNAYKSAPDESIKYWLFESFLGTKQRLNNVL